ncbi:hypothetical protein [Salinicola halophilus]|uniref:hypothetical protein n=1 Tax=Salinicola halophilus TaxID=184065 RepID=UPI000DA24837|nr:hypothetical protein [Salinicola halophilus]
MSRFSKRARCRLPTRASRPRLLLQVACPSAADRGTPDSRVEWRALWWADGGEPEPRWRHLTPDMTDELATLRQRLQRRQGVLLLDPAATSHFHLATPPGLRRREWPTLLEESLCGDVTALTLHPLSHQRGELEILAIDTARLLAWRDWADRLDLTIDSWSTAFMMQPEADDPDRLSVMATSDHWLLKALGEPLAGRSSRQRQWLAWPRGWPLSQLPPAWLTRQWHLAPEGRLVEPAALEADDVEDVHRQPGLWLERLPATLPRLPGAERSRPRGLRGVSPGRSTRRLGIAAVLLGLILGGITLTQWQLDRRAHIEEARARLASRFVDGAIPRDAGARLLQRREALDRLRARNQRLDTWQTELAERFGPDDWRLIALSVEDGELTSEWERLGREPISPPSIPQARFDWSTSKRLIVHLPLEAEAATAAAERANAEETS